jgi:SAM-dependent methyltransferase
LKSRLREAIVRQFGRPTGFVGRLVGLVMATRPSNLERNRRTIDLLQIQPDDRVLEIGYGPGLAIQWAAERAVRGKVVGVDHSELMRRQATRRNACAIQTGHVELHTAPLDAMPVFDGRFDKVFAVNVSGRAAARPLCAHRYPGLVHRASPRRPGRSARAAQAGARRGARRLRGPGAAGAGRARLPVDRHAPKIEAGLSAGDEVAVVAFLRTSVEPLLDHLGGFGPGVRERVEAYRAAIDPAFGVVYRGARGA